MIKLAVMPNLLEFVRTIKLELAQVKWPTHQEALRLTGAVIFASAAVALYAGGLDVLFTSLLQQILNR